MLDPGIVGGLLLPVLGAFAGEFMYIHIYIYIHIYYIEVHIHFYIHIYHVVCVWSDSFVCDSFVCDVASAYVLHNTIGSRRVSSACGSALLLVNSNTFIYRYM